MRLIDAHKLIDEIARNIPAGTSQQDLEWSVRVAQSFVNIIDNQPTAYDVDKVIKELESLVEDREEDIINDEYTYGECSAYESAIRVVKRGGIESNDLITKCKGGGQGSCKRCNDKGIWNRHWMSMLYEIKGYNGYYCWDCAKDIVKVGGIDETK